VLRMMVTVGYLMVSVVGDKSRTGEHVLNRKGDFLKAVLTR